MTYDKICKMFIKFKFVGCEFHFTNLIKLAQKEFVGGLDLETWKFVSHIGMFVVQILGSQFHHWRHVALQRVVLILFKCLDIKCKNFLFILCSSYWEGRYSLLFVGHCYVIEKAYSFGLGAKLGVAVVRANDCESCYNIK